MCIRIRLSMNTTHGHLYRSSLQQGVLGGAVLVNSAAPNAAVVTVSSSTFLNNKVHRLGLGVGHSATDLCVAVTTYQISCQPAKQAEILIDKTPPTKPTNEPTNASAHATQATSGDGGGVWAQDTPVSLTRTTFRNNSALVNGGAVYLTFSSNYNRNESALAAKGGTFRNNFISGSSCNGGTSPLGGGVYVQQENTLFEIKLSILGATFDGNRAPASGCPGSAVVTSRTVDTAPKLTVTLTGSTFKGALCNLFVKGGWRGVSPCCVQLQPTVTAPCFWHPTNQLLHPPSSTTYSQLPGTGRRLWRNLGHPKQRRNRFSAAHQSADHHLRYHLFKRLQQLLRCGCHDPGLSAWIRCWHGWLFVHVCCLCGGFNHRNPLSVLTFQLLKPGNTQEQSPKLPLRGAAPPLTTSLLATEHACELAHNKIEVKLHGGVERLTYCPPPTPRSHGEDDSVCCLRRGSASLVEHCFALHACDCSFLVVVPSLLLLSMSISQGAEQLQELSGPLIFIVSDSCMCPLHLCNYCAGKR